MNSKDVINNIKNVNKELEALYIKKNSLLKQIVKLKNECSHDLVVMLCDHKEHKVGVIYDCICPACGKRVDVYPTHELENSVFKNSRVVNLTHLSIYDYNSVLNNIVENYDYYYENSIDDSKILKKII